MREVSLGVGVAVLVGLASGAMMKPDLIPALTRDGSMSPVEPHYSDDDTASYAPAAAPFYYDSWASGDQAALLQSASYDTGDADLPRYDPRPAPEDRAWAVRDAALQDSLDAPPPAQAPVRYPSASGDILAGLTPDAPDPATVPLDRDPHAALAAPAPTPLPTDETVETGDTRPAAPPS